MTDDEVIDNATTAMAESILENGILRNALEKIEKGLVDTKSTPGQRMTLMAKVDAWRIAFNALAEVDCRRIIVKTIRNHEG